MRRIPSLIMAFLACHGLFGQYQIGQSISNYSGTNGIYSNPSNVADSRFKFYWNVFQSNVHISNDFMSWQGTYHPFAVLVDGQPVVSKIWPLPESARDSTGNIMVNLNDVKETINGKPKNAFLQLEQRLFNAMINLGPRTAIGVGARFRAMGQLTNVTEPLAVMSRYGFDTDSLPFQTGQFGINELYRNNSFNLNFATFNEASLTLGHAIIMNKKHLFKVGVTGKVFMPVYAMYIRNQNTNIRVIGKDTVELSDVNMEYGYVSDDYTKENSGGFNPFLLGRGFGLDIGFTYEFRPDYEKYQYQMDGKTKIDPGKNKYLIRVQGSLNDLGSVNMANNKYVRNYKLSPNSVLTFEPSIFDTLTMLQDRYAREYGTLSVIDSMVGRYLGFESQGNAFSWKLPAVLNLNVDFRVVKNTYVNVLWIQTLRQEQVNGLRGFSAVAITPRYETRYFEIALPVQLTQNYTATQLGLYLRGGPFWIGTDNLNALYAKKGIYGADFYMGLALPVHRKKEKDRDNDGVSNRKDKCKKIPGTWENMGCPPDLPELNQEELEIKPE